MPHLLTRPPRLAVLLHGSNDFAADLLQLGFEEVAGSDGGDESASSLLVVIETDGRRGAGQ